MIKLFAQLSLIDEIGERNSGGAVDQTEKVTSVSGRLRSTDWHIRSL